MTSTVLNPCHIDSCQISPPPPPNTLSSSKLAASANSCRHCSRAVHQVSGVREHAHSWHGTRCSRAGSPERYVRARTGGSCREWQYTCAPPVVVQVATLNAAALLVVYLALYVYFIHRREPSGSEVQGAGVVVQVATLNASALLVVYLALYAYFHPQA